jgi:diacylglycerol O-acyltransferase
VERAGSADLMFAVVRRGVPQQFGAILVLEPGKGFDVDVVSTALTDRVCAVPRLRQRLVKVPLGCGRPIWVDDDSFSHPPAHRVRHVPFPG